MSENRRSILPPIEPANVARVPAGGRLTPLYETGAAHRRDFMLLRRQGQSPVRLSLPHIAIYKELWRIWLKKRINEQDCSSTALEIQEATGLVLASVSSALDSMVRNGMVRKTEESIGWRGTRNRYTPTQTGIELLALAEYLGDGALVQVGKKTSEWQEPGSAEPHNLFDFARLLSGGKINAEADQV